MNDYNAYIVKYAKKNNITEAEAKTHAICEEVRKYYEERNSLKEI